MSTSSESYSRYVDALTSLLSWESERQAGIEAAESFGASQLNAVDAEERQLYAFWKGCGSECEALGRDLNALAFRLGVHANEESAIFEVKSGEQLIREVRKMKQEAMSIESNRKLFENLQAEALEQQANVGLRQPPEPPAVLPTSENDQRGVEVANNRRGIFILGTAVALALSFGLAYLFI